MPLEQLRTFVAVAERQHMTRAAEALNLTQQAVSSAIVTLENAYSIVLFRRVSRRIELTEAEIAVAAAEKGPRRCCRKQTTHQKEKLRPSRTGADCGRTAASHLRVSGNRLSPRHGKGRQRAGIKRLDGEAQPFESPVTK